MNRSGSSETSNQTPHGESPGPFHDGRGFVVTGYNRPDPMPLVLHAARNVSPRRRPLTAEEKLVRETAYGLKIPTTTALETAVPSMAALLDPGPCWLVPVPSSSGDITANLAIAKRRQG